MSIIMSDSSELKKNWQSTPLSLQCSELRGSLDPGGGRARRAGKGLQPSLHCSGELVLRDHDDNNLQETERSRKSS